MVTLNQMKKAASKMSLRHNLLCQSPVFVLYALVPDDLDGSDNSHWVYVDSSSDYYGLCFKAFDMRDEFLDCLICRQDMIISLSDIVNACGDK